MIRFGYRCEEERYAPSILLRRVVDAEKLGFEFTGVADHFHPWFHREGAAGQAWVFIGAAAARTSKIVLGTSITSPVYRYHPAIIAQSFATLAEMFPERICLGLGTGEAMNEVALGFEWPKFATRFEIIKESVTVIRRLWSEEFVSFEGRHFRLRGANLYTRPTHPPQLYIAASGPTMARFAGEFGDGFIAGVGVRPDFSKAKKLLELVDEGAKSVGKDPSKLRKNLIIPLSYDKDYEKALKSIGRWSIQGTDDPGLSDFFRKDLYDPRLMDKIGEAVDLHRFAKRWLVCTDLEEVVKEVEGVAGSGYNDIEIFSVSPDEDAFLSEFGEKSLPYLKSKYRGA